MKIGGLGSGYKDGEQDRCERRVWRGLGEGRNESHHYEQEGQTAEVRRRVGNLFSEVFPQAVLLDGTGDGEACAHHQKHAP